MTSHVVGDKNSYFQFIICPFIL